MKGYISKFDKAQAYVDSQFSKENYTEAERKRVLKQIFAKFVVGQATIGYNANTGKIYSIKTNPFQGINFKSQTQRNW
jgi:hypothetical protein